MIKPYRNMILVEPEEARSESEGGIIIPEQAQVKTSIGKVVNIADGIKSVKIGEKIFYNKWAGVNADGGLIIKEADVIGVFDE